MKLETLMRKARTACEWRGHLMSRFARTEEHYATSTCERCNRNVLVCDKPMPNEIDIGGEAVALGCNQ